MKKPANAAERETARCEFLHQLCCQIHRQIAAGSKAGDAIRAASHRRRKQLFKHGRLSRQRLTVLYYEWRRNPSPKIFFRHYKPGLPRVPAALQEEFINRLLAAPRIVPAAVILRTMRAAWRAGEALPGVGSWRDYDLRRHGSQFVRVQPPRFPYSDASLFRAISGPSGRSYQQRVIAALQGQAAVERYYRFLESRKAAIAHRRRHEPLGTPFRQQT
ncbi:MAG: hypothetical protein KIT44_09390 [Opitutaceae bacterium]|nr:hypothetical protein [Opitutaceae bacterium]